MTKTKLRKKFTTENLKELGKIEEMGVNDSGKEIYKQTDKNVWLSETKYQMPCGKIVSIDGNEKSFEAYNPNKYTIILENIHPNPADSVPTVIKILPDDFAFIPHRYFVPWIDFVGNKTKDQITMIENHGRNMFIGNKKVSSPTERKQLF